MRLALVLAVAMLLVPASAAASTATVVEGYENDSVLVYTAGDGEANRLQVHEAGGSIVLTDPGADIDAENGCTPAGPHAVTCTGEFSLFGVRADLGDLGDTVASDGPGLD